MKPTVRTPSRILCFVTVFLLSSCAEIRFLTYPANFTWIGKEHMKTSMHSMANSISELNTLLDDDKDTESKQALVLQELDTIEQYALTLQGETAWSVTDRNTQRTNHVLLNDNLDDFISLVGKARLQAQAEPANYYGAGKITGGCASCHRIR